MRLIRASYWNKLVSDVRKGVPRSGAGTLLTRTGAGVNISMPDQAVVFPHPWTLRPYLDGGVWHAEVSPGFVNGYDPVVVMKSKNRDKKKAGKPVDVKLADAYVRERTEDFPDGSEASLRFDGFYYPQEFPEYFKREGVKKPDDGSSFKTFIGGTTTKSFSQDLQDAKDYGDRLLCSADVILVIDHVGSRSDVEIIDPATGRIVGYSQAFTMPPDRYPLRMNTISRFVPPYQNTLSDRVKGDFTEPNYTEILMSRLWMVSPPNADPEVDRPGPGWIPHVQYFVTWNINAVQPQVFLSAGSPDEAMRIGVPLGGGALAILGDAMLAPFNDMMSNAKNAVTSIDTTMHYWSP